LKYFELANNRKSNFPCRFNQANEKRRIYYKKRRAMRVFLRKKSDHGVVFYVCIVTELCPLSPEISLKHTIQNQFLIMAEISFSLDETPVWVYNFMMDCLSELEV
jgi:hypothetical protein